MNEEHYTNRRLKLGTRLRVHLLPRSLRYFGVESGWYSHSFGFWWGEFYWVRQ